MGSPSSGNFAGSRKPIAKSFCSHSWKGSGLALNALRSVLAREHAAQTTANCAESAALPSGSFAWTHPPFPSYDEWLSDVDNGGGRSRPDSAYFLPAKAETGESGPLRPVRGYSPERIGSRVHYAKPPGASAAFVDFGRSIAMCGSGIDDDALFAAMTLAVQKWEKFVASGDPAFLAASVRSGGAS